MKRKILLGTALGTLLAVPAYAGKPGTTSTLDQAKAYTDTQVAAEATMRGAADTAEAGLRVAGDNSLQAAIDASKLRTIRVGPRGLKPTGIATIENDGVCAWSPGGLLVADIPAGPGARIKSYSVTFRDLDPGASSVVMLRYSKPDMSGGSDGLAAPLQAEAAEVQSQVRVFSWSGDILVNANDYFYVGLKTTNGFTTENVAVCGLTVTYLEP